MAIRSLFSGNTVEVVEPLVLRPVVERRGSLAEDNTVYLTAFPAAEAQLHVSIR